MKKMKKIFFFIIIFIPVNIYSEDINKAMFESINNPAKVLELIKKGVDVNYIDDKSRDCCLSLAAHLGYLGTVKILLENKSNPDLRYDENSDTPLISAVYFSKDSIEHKNRIPIITLLLQYGADINKQSLKGRTALMKYIIFNSNSLDLKEHIEIIKLLLDAGSDLNIRDELDMTSLDYAKQYNDTIVIGLINDQENMISEKMKLTFKNNAVLNLMETADTKAKIIVKLPKGNKVKPVVIGKTDTINKIKGNWIKVKTETGDAGWCFDGFLEIVK
jgi:ankyrin repeat protein